jgi:hypothetical protein
MSKLKFIAFNGFPFHYEMIGLILDFCKTYEFEITIVNKNPDLSWIRVYQQKYSFQIMQSIPPKHILTTNYDYIILLTDDDIHFPDSDIIPSKTYCFDHHINNRRPCIPIEHHIPIFPFATKNIISYSLPIFQYIDYSSKQDMLKKNTRPRIVFLGNNNLHHYLSIHHILQNAMDFDIHIINRHIPRSNIFLPKNIYLHENISAESMFDFLVSSQYVGFLCDESSEHYQSVRMTASIPLAFTTGCKLFLPKEMNRQLRLTSIVEYDTINKPFVLDTHPCLKSTFQERDRLVRKRDDCLHPVFYRHLRGHDVKTGKEEKEKSV